MSYEAKGAAPVLVSVSERLADLTLSMNQGCRFMALPSELRRKIYQFTFCNMCIMPTISEGLVIYGETVLQHLPGIVFVSRKVKAEAWPVLFSEATFLYDQPGMYIKKPNRFSRLVPREDFHLIHHLMAPSDDSGLEQPMPLSDFPNLKTLTFENVNMWPPWKKHIELDDTAAAHAALVRWARNEYKVLKHATRCPWIGHIFENPSRSFRIWIKLRYVIHRADWCGERKDPQEGCAVCCRFQASTIDPELGIVVNDGFGSPQKAEDERKAAECEGKSGSWRFYCSPEALRRSDAELEAAEEEQRGVQWGVICNPM